MRGFELIQAVEQAAHKLCSALGLSPVSIVWSASVPTAAINERGTVYLCDVQPDEVVSRSLLNRYVGFVLHELLHHKFTNFSAHGRGEYLKRLHNAVEDIWIERKAVSQGLTGNVEGLLADLIDDMVGEALAGVTDWADPKQYPFALAVVGRRYARRTVPLAEGLEPIFSEASLRIDACCDSFDTLRVAEWVLTKLQLPNGQSPSQSESNPDGQPKGEQGKGEQSNDQGQGKGEQSKDQGQGEAQQGTANGAGDAQSKKQGEGKGKGTGKPVGPRKAVQSAHQAAVEVEPSSPKGEGQTSGTFDRADVGRNFERLPKYEHENDITVVSGGRLRYEVKRLFDNTGRTDWDTNRKSGSLNVRALPKLATGGVRVFQRRDEVEGVDSAVLILLDISSSMWDFKRIDPAIKATLAIHQAVVSGGAACSVVAFGSRVHQVAGWGTPTAKLAQTMLHMSSGGSTNDAQAVRFTGDMLLARPEERKVLFVLTDGMGDIVETRKRVQALERCGITVVGVGIGFDVSMVYTQHIQVDDVSKLGTMSLKKIKAIV
jgi:Mg-chelatase subunit ChlD